MSARRNDRAQAERLTLGRQIRAHRIARGLTQPDIQQRVGTGKAQMYAIEHASSDVLTGTLIDVAAAVGLEVALAGEHHLPLLDLTAAEVAALIHAAAAHADQWATDGEASGLPADQPDPHLLSALAKTALDADTYPGSYPLGLCQPADPTA
ncbi:helix-turn-helix domain-containing protein [Micromonospora sp. DT229]|uniref:helix-turn-helix domain-containing protein n=1 Tax=Micromonospora sp. DT229 TaxID=3393430 RepID=UPI003CE6E506